ncbi:hypothetical protein MTP99_018497 [Tenebrio molitor]|jgi:hypothetical protein|nr:hypothetical protein MTP99_018495 [Tenebrio molitor]KAJ3624908.1 hypothetical protein MTP99_018497 [Tenebrio molitor]
MRSPNALCITIVFFTLISSAVHCIRCFNCSSRTNMNCVTFEGDNASMIVECPQPNAFCRKTRQIITADSTTIITRACGWIKFEEHSGDYCMVTNTNFKQETSCQCFTDTCNTGSMMTGQALFLSIVSALISLSGY